MADKQFTIASTINSEVKYTTKTASDIISELDVAMSKISQLNHDLSSTSYTSTIQVPVNYQLETVKPISSETIAESNISNVYRIS